MTETKRRLHRTRRCNGCRRYLSNDNLSAWCRSCLGEASRIAGLPSTDTTTVWGRVKAWWRKWFAA